MAFLAWLIAFLAGIASGTYLVVTGHYGWAWIPFLIVACIEVKNSRLTPTAPTGESRDRQD